MESDHLDEFVERYYADPVSAKKYEVYWSGMFLCFAGALAFPMAVFLDEYVLEIIQSSPLPTRPVAKDQLIPIPDLAAYAIALALLLIGFLFFRASRDIESEYRQDKLVQVYFKFAAAIHEFQSENYGRSKSYLRNFLDDLTRGSNSGTIHRKRHEQLKRYMSNVEKFEDEERQLKVYKSTFVAIASPICKETLDIVDDCTVENEIEQMDLPDKKDPNLSDYLLDLSRPVLNLQWKVYILLAVAIAATIVGVIQFGGSVGGAVPGFVLILISLREHYKD